MREMNNQKRSKRQNIMLIGMNIVIGVLCLILLGRVVSMIESVVYACGRSVNAGQLERDVRYDDFANLLGDYYTDMTTGARTNAEIKEYYGVAKYYEAMFWYKAYMETGDQERASEELKKAEEAYDEMGSWNILAESIGNILSLSDESIP